jgi:hypothetical protein
MPHADELISLLNTTDLSLPEHSERRPVGQRSQIIGIWPAGSTVRASRAFWLLGTTSRHYE